MFVLAFHQRGCSARGVEYEGFINAKGNPVRSFEAARKFPTRGEAYNCLFHNGVRMYFDTFICPVEKLNLSMCG